MLKFQTSADLQKRVEKIIHSIPFHYIHPGRVKMVESKGSKSKASARIYAFPRIFQEILGLEPVYIIEVISERFDRLSEEQKDKVLIHELLHIPKTFSGALVPHNCFGRKIRDQVEVYYQHYQRNSRFNLN